MWRRSRVRGCFDLSPHAEATQRELPIDLRLKINRTCEALCDGQCEKSGASDRVDDLCASDVENYVLRYRRGRPGDYSPKCGRKITVWVVRIEVAA